MIERYKTKKAHRLTAKLIVTSLKPTWRSVVNAIIPKLILPFLCINEVRCSWFFEKDHRFHKSYSLRNIDAMSSSCAILYLAAFFADGFRDHSWLQVDLGSSKRVLGVMTQGRPVASPQWIISFEILYGNSTSSLVSIQNKLNQNVVS